MSPKPDVSQQRKIQILEAATAVFARSGFGKTRMDDIAKESGLSKGALYLYFKSKDEIFGAILDRFFQREFNAIARLADNQELSPREKMNMVTGVILQDLEQMKFAMPIFFEFWSMSFRKKSVRAMFQAYMRSYINMILPVVELGMSSGDFRKGDPYAISMAFGSLIEGSLVVWSYDPDNTDLRSLLSNNVEIFLDGLESNNR